jgi:hypothetical protein
LAVASSHASSTVQRMRVKRDGMCARSALRALRPATQSRASSSGQTSRRSSRSFRCGGRRTPVMTAGSRPASSSSASGSDPCARAAPGGGS